MQINDCDGNITKEWDNNEWIKEMNEWIKYWDILLSLTTSTNAARTRRRPKCTHKNNICSDQKKMSCHLLLFCRLRFMQRPLGPWGKLWRWIISANWWLVNRTLEERWSSLGLRRLNKVLGEKITMARVVQSIIFVIVVFFSNLYIESVYFSIRRKLLEGPNSKSKYLNISICLSIEKHKEGYSDPCRHKSWVASQN